jgi:SPX domain protein involved in polyphosphate accumulation
MQRQRFELKYTVHEPIAEKIRDFVLAHLELDPAGAGNPDRSYQVNSIYLDSEDLCSFWDWVNANRNRFKLRMRYYSEGPEFPVFLEIKRRIKNCILKQRCSIRKRAAPAILAGQFPAESDIVTRDEKSRAALENFIGMVADLKARPVALVSYRREAYIDSANEGVRVTFDRDVRIAPRRACDFSLEMNRFVRPFGDLVILELKFTNRFPNWFNDMVQTLGLDRGAAAKYCEGVAGLWHPELGNFPGSQIKRRFKAARPENLNSEHPPACSPP